MVLSMFLCVPFVKGLQNGWFRYHWTGVVIQHLFQTAYLGVAIAWGFVRDWYWVQSGFLVLREWDLGSQVIRAGRRMS
jgi:sterol O-acyltransferase